MSSGSPEDAQRSANRHVRSAVITGVISTFLLGGFFFFGKELWESSKRIKTVLKTQESDQKRIRDNSTIVGVVQQRLEDVLNAGENQRLSYEEMHKRFVEMEKMLASVLRRTNETRHEIDAAASRKALQNAETIAVTALADKCEQSLLKMKELTVNWEVEHMPLLTNDRGRQLATDEKTIQAFMLAIAGDFPVVKDSIEWLAKFEEVVRPLRGAAAQGIKNFLTISETHTFLESLLTKTNEANQRLKKRRLAVEVILATTADFDSGERTLAQSIENVEKQDASLILSQALQIHEKRIKEKAAKLAESLSKKVEDRMDFEAARDHEAEDILINAAKRKKEDRSRDEAIAQEEARKKQLEKEFEIEKSEINRLLGGLLGVRDSQPAQNYSLRSPNMRGMRPGLLSLGRLDSIGALDQTEEGYELLFRIGGETEYNRKKSGFPNYVANGMAKPTIAVKVKRASELLNKYRELLIEKKLIGP